MKNLNYYLITCLLACSTIASAQSANPNTPTTGSSKEKWSGLRVSYKPITVECVGEDDDLTGISVDYTYSSILSENVPLFVEGGLGYQYSYDEESEEGIHAKMVIHSLNIPLKLGYKHHLDEKIYLTPHVGLNLRGNLSGTVNVREEYYGEEVEIDIFDDKEMGDAAFKRIQMGWQIGIGLNLGKIYAGVSYGGDFNEIAEDSKFNTTSITLGINF